MLIMFSNPTAQTTVVKPPLLSVNVLLEENVSISHHIVFIRITSSLVIDYSLDAQVQIFRTQSSNSLHNICSFCTIFNWNE